jgi:hypothetical protein
VTNQSHILFEAFNPPIPIGQLGIETADFMPPTV